MSSESRKTRKKVRKDAKISRKRREERERDKEKAYVKRPISSEEQREKEIQRAPENKLKRGHEQRSEPKRFRERKGGKLCLIWVFSHAKAQKNSNLFSQSSFDTSFSL